MIELGRATENNLGLPPWNLPFANSLSPSNPLEGVLYRNESQNIDTQNKHRLIDGPNSPNGDIQSYSPSLQRLSSEEILTKETVDAAVALTSMANLNNLRRDTKTTELPKS